jgi:hypothetical protein
MQPISLDPPAMALISWVFLAAIVISVSLLALLLAFRFAFFAFLPAIEHIWPARLFHSLEAAEAGGPSQRVTRQQLRQLIRGGMVARASGGPTQLIAGHDRWYLLKPYTIESARNLLDRGIARTAIEQREAYANRPRWRWGTVELPISDKLLKFSDRIFKLFQWLLVAVGMRVLGKVSDDRVLICISNILLIIAVLPHVVSLSESLFNRLEVTPQISGRYFILPLLVVLSVALVITIVLIVLVQHVFDTELARALTHPK